MKGVEMNAIVRRTSAALAPSSSASPNALVVDRMHRNRDVLVRCQLSVDVRPSIYLAWHVHEAAWRKGYRLKIFRSANGFSPERYPDDLTKHGQMIAEAHEDSTYIEHPPEGTLFYTFLLQRKYLFGLMETLSVLRFSETIPSAKVAIGRIEDRVRLKELEQRYELGVVNHQASMGEAELRLLQVQRKLQAKQNPATPRPSQQELPESISESIRTADTVVASVIAIHKRMEALKIDPEFLKLPVATQRMILKHLKRDADVAEISAKLKMSGK
jgi:hypothetical protein